MAWSATEAAVTLGNNMSECTAADTACARILLVSMLPTVPPSAGL